MTGFLRRLWGVAWRIALLLVLWGGLYAPFVLPFFLFWTEHQTLVNPANRLFIEFSAATTVFLAAWGMTRFADRRSLAEIGFRLRHWLGHLSLGTLLGGLLIALALGACWILGWAGVTDSSVLSVSALAWAAAALLANTLTQEIIVRGYMLNVIRRHFGMTSALLATSLIFMVMHAGVLTWNAHLPMLNLFLAGLLLGQSYLITGSLWLPVGIHFGWNYMQGPVLGLAVTGQDLGGGWSPVQLHGPVVCTGGDFGLEGGFVCTAVLLAGIIIFHYLQRHRPLSVAP